MTNADPLLTDLLHQVTLEQIAVARLELARLQAQRTELEATPVASTKESPRRIAKKRWLLSAIFAALLLLGYDQRATVGALIDKYVSPAHIQVGSQRLDVHTFATAAVAVQGRILATIVPTVDTLPAATPIPTIGTGATVPQEEAPTPHAAQMPRDNGQHDVQEGNAPVQAAPPPPVEQAAPAAPAPAPPAQPTAAPTQEPQGDVVAASQDADRPALNANGEPLMDWAAEAAQAQSAQKALELQQKLQQQGFRP